MKKLVLRDRDVYWTHLAVVVKVLVRGRRLRALDLSLIQAPRPNLMHSL